MPRNGYDNSNSGIWHTPPMPEPENTQGTQRMGRHVRKTSNDPRTTGNVRAPHDSKAVTGSQAATKLHTAPGQSTAGVRAGSHVKAAHRPQDAEANRSGYPESQRGGYQGRQREDYPNNQRSGHSSSQNRDIAEDNLRQPRRGVATPSQRQESDLHQVRRVRAVEEDSNDDLVSEMREESSKSSKQVFHTLLIVVANIIYWPIVVAGIASPFMPDFNPGTLSM